MLHIFNKKEYLVDSLGGLVDIHNHILPGIDDGAKNVQDSITLIKGLNDFGISRFICTPHIMHNYYPNNPQTIQKALSSLKSEMKKQGLEDTQLDVSAEHMIDDNFEQILQNNEVMPLRKFHILIEMSYLQPPINFNTALNKIISKGLFPILAHPERYLFINSTSRRLGIYKQKGVLFQLNLLSLANYYGSDIKSKAIKLMEKNLVDFVGSDIHNISQLNTIKEATISKSTGKILYSLVNNTIERFY
ncbi:MAG: tyrosine-protein phosphatase [Croceivirga sp.]